MLDELEWPSLEARRDQSSLFLFHMIHCGAVFIKKDKYMTPAHRLKTTRSSHSAQYRRHWSDIQWCPEEFSFPPPPPPPELFHIGIVCLLLWPIPSLQRSLGHALLKQKFSQKFLCFCVVLVLFLSCFCFFFILSKFPNSQSLVLCSSMSETSKDGKKGIKSRNYYEKFTYHARKRVFWYNINLPFNNAAIV